jgi:hypothetical protein
MGFDLFSPVFHDLADRRHTERPGYDRDQRTYYFSLARNEGSDKHCERTERDYHSDDDDNESEKPTRALHARRSFKVSGLHPTSSM